MKKSKLQTNQKMRQQSFYNLAAQSQKKFFGGALLKDKRKSLRPLSSKDAIHFVLRSSWAIGKDSFLASRNHKAIDRIITNFAKKFGIKIYHRAINSNHIHILLKITNRVLYRAFIRAVAGKIASQVMGEQSFKLFCQSRLKSKAGEGSKTLEKGQKFWEFRPFSRIVNWGQDYKTCVEYLRQNISEALGFVPYKTRKNYYSAWFRQSIPDI